MTKTKANVTVDPQAVFDRYIDCIRRGLRGDILTGTSEWRRGEHTGEVKFLRDLEQNGGKIVFRKMGEGTDSAAIGVPSAQTQRFQLDALAAESCFRQANPGQTVPYTIHEHLRRLIDNFVERGDQLPA